jgi:hypothetical protein
LVDWLAVEKAVVMVASTAYEMADGMVDWLAVETADWLVDGTVDALAEMRAFAKAVQLELQMVGLLVDWLAA